jgi:uncharacterized membrane protein YeiH
MLQVPVAIELGAVVVGALSGGIHAVNRKADVIGTFAIALATSVGGGMVRDVLIGAGPPAALQLPRYLPAVAVAAVLASLFARWLSRFDRVLNVVDALLIGMWTVLGAEKALAHGLPTTSALFLGTVTATGGSVLRDVASGVPPAIVVKGELHVTVALVAACVYVTMVQGLRSPAWLAEAATIATAFLMRLAAVHWHITAPEPIDLPARWRAYRGRRRRHEA